MSQRVAILGASGLLGSWLVREYQEAELLATCHSRPGPGLVCLELADLKALTGLIRGFKPEVVFLCAALSDPSQCQAEPKTAWAINTAPAGRLAELAREIGFRLIFISSDLVFDGTKGDYVETDPTAPLSVYGSTKEAAEKAVLSARADCLAVRISLLLGSDFQGLAGNLAWMNRSFRAGQKVHLFVDEFRSPAAAAELAR
ncbi:MAG: sugar nucleotide-binding protein, partial [Deltaproteobacteria bacterium]|nr:sugar nucleotide-binding protein [Deltaproteobacteria bacterium]